MRGPGSTHTDQNSTKLAGPAIDMGRSKSQQICRVVAIDTDRSICVKYPQGYGPIKILSKLRAGRGFALRNLDALAGQAGLRATGPTSAGRIIPLGCN